ncbi:hypothetical protein C0039_17220 [Pseudohalioglobus lutimaris]|uniref:PilY1 beta-propeller domain-containing protein n=1 Tax=Pseudohalioglobus lutimaris TaxID=1737061 RepID=A0A2N5WZ00_9GAMM|nr:hypothetical protein C0039_17220 [Pseudohalioglobus lutimaris]
MMGWFRICLMACLIIRPAHAVADDVDLFLGPSVMQGESVNVLILLDNSSNWARKSAAGTSVLESVRTALAEVLRGTADRSINVGLMLYAEGGEGNGSGGYLRAAIRPMTAVSAERYARQVEELDVHDDRGVDGQFALAQAEAYLYFSGGEATSGAGRQKTDGLSEACVTTAGVSSPPACPAVSHGSAADTAVWTLPGVAIDGGRYLSPDDDATCSTNLFLFISHGPNRGGATASQRSQVLLSQLSGNTVSMGLNRSAGGGDISTQWSRFMAQSRHSITTHIIDVAPGQTEADRVWSERLKGIADVASGKYMRTDGTVSDVRLAIRRAIADATTMNAAIAPVALPASAHTRGLFLNQVFMGQFRPDEYGRLRWPGNLKQYRLGLHSAAGVKRLSLLDADQRPALDDESGRVRDCARSYWTPVSPDTYWNYLTRSQGRGECTASAQEPGSNVPDGAVVEKGGQAYVGRGGERYASAVSASRVVKTTAATFCGGETGVACRLDDFNTSNAMLTAERLGASSTAERTHYISWARGADTEDEDGDGNVDEYRPSLHGDVVHSQPVALDYSTVPDEQRVIVLYGSNDGLLRAINGDRGIAHNGSGKGVPILPGAEFWVFMPAEFHSRIGRLLRNDIQDGGPLSGKVYGPDGPLTTWQSDAGRHYLSMAMRRGGRAVYGFDITETDSPVLLWHLGCSSNSTDSGSCATGWEDVGQTWSPLQPAWQRGAPSPYLIMGGGYDNCEDMAAPAAGEKHACEQATAGNAIYVLDAMTGAIVARFETERAVPGRVTIVPRADGDRNISYAYAADTGGNVYRLSGPSGEAIGDTPPTRWLLTPIASLGCGHKAGEVCSDRRKFLSGPDVVRIPGAARYAILLGSGDKEKQGAAVDTALLEDNYFFALVDAPADPAWLESERATCNADLICADSLPQVALDPETLPSASIGKNGNSIKGWKLKLRKGEQVVSAALTVNDKVHFSTHRPDSAQPASCSTNQGIATRYSVDYRLGKGELTDIPGGGLLPMPVAGRVELEDGDIAPFCIGCGGKHAIGGDIELDLPAEAPRPGGRVYWKIGE